MSGDGETIHRLAGLMRAVYPGRSAEFCHERACLCCEDVGVAASELLAAREVSRRFLPTQRHDHITRLCVELDLIVIDSVSRHD